MPKKIAITGGIGSGKSTVAKYIKEQGIPVFSCDEINRRLWEESEFLSLLSKVFPSACKEGKIQKEALKALVFSDEAELSKLNKIAHPKIMKKLMKDIEACDSPLVFAEVPLLFEGGYESRFDGIIVVLRNKESRVRAVEKRDHLTQKEILARIERQYNYREFEKPFQKQNFFILKNDGDLPALKISINEILKQL